MRSPISASLLTLFLGVLPGALLAAQDASPQKEQKEQKPAARGKDLDPEQAKKKAAPMDVAREQRRVAGLISALIEKRKSYVAGFGDMDRLRKLSKLDPKFEKKLFKLAPRRLLKALPYVRCFGGLRDPETGSELYAVLCTSAKGVKELMDSQKITFRGPDEPIENYLDPQRRKSFAMRLGKNSIVVLQLRKSDALYRSVIRLRSKFRKLDAPQQPVAWMKGRGADFLWPYYSGLVETPAKQPAPLLKLLGIRDYGAACKHVDENFQNGSKHCNSIHNYDIILDDAKGIMTWRLEYKDAELRDEMFEAIHGIPEKTARRMELDLSGSKGKLVLARHKLYIPQLTRRAVEALLVRALISR